MRIKHSDNCYINYGKDDINEQHRKINGELRKEIERLNNIINELEKYIKESCWKDDWGVESIYVKTLLDKLQELKGDGSND